LPKGSRSPATGGEYLPLNNKEISTYFGDIDIDKDGSVSFAELEGKLLQVLKELAPEPKKHHLNYPSRREDPEKNNSHSSDGLHALLCNIVPDCGAQINRDDFMQHVRKWEIPSQDQSALEEAKMTNNLYSTASTSTGWSAKKTTFSGSQTS